MRIGTAALERWTARREQACAGKEIGRGGDGGNAGAGYMLLAMAGFTFNDALAKGIGDSLSVAQLIAVRGTMLVVLMGVFFTWRQHRGSVAVPLFEATRRAMRQPLVLARSLCELLATAAFLTALTQLPFAVLASLLQAMPLLVTAGAALFLGEAVGWRRWLAIMVGLCGVLVILRPGASGFADDGLAFGIGCVVLSAGRDLCTRRIPVDVPSLGVTMVSVLLMTLCALVWCTFGGEWRAMSIAQLALLAGAALCLFAGMQGIVLAMRSGDVAAIMPYRYTGLVWAVLLGWLFYAEVPDLWTLVGGGIVVGTGLYTFARERRVARRAVF